MDTIIDFEDITPNNRAIKRLAQAFTRAGTPVVSIDVEPKTKRTSGVSYRELHLTFADNQKITLAIKASGDIFQVRMNGSVQPIKSQGDQKKAVAELVKLLDANRAKHQQKMARLKVALPKGIRTAAPRMEVALQAKVADLNTQITEAKTTVNSMLEELGEPVLDSAVLDAVSGAAAKAKQVSKLLIEKHGWKSGRAGYAEKGGLSVASATNSAHGTFVGVWRKPGLDLIWRSSNVSGSAAGLADEIADLTGREKVLDSVNLDAACELAESIIAGHVLDSVGHAVAVLSSALDMVENNLPISESEGDFAQARLQAESAKSIRKALEMLGYPTADIAIKGRGGRKATLQNTSGVGQCEKEHTKEVRVLDDAEEEADDEEEPEVNENQESLF